MEQRAVQLRPGEQPQLKGYRPKRLSGRGCRVGWAGVNSTLSRSRVTTLPEPRQAPGNVKVGRNDNALSKGLREEVRTDDRSAMSTPNRAGFMSARVREGLHFDRVSPKRGQESYYLM